jgi:hypothetical protein
MNFGAHLMELLGRDAGLNGREDLIDRNQNLPDQQLVEAPAAAFIVLVAL